MTNIYSEKISEKWLYLLEVLNTNNANSFKVEDLTNKQILLILSLQESIADIYSEDIYIKRKKKRGGKLDINRLSKNFYTEEGEENTIQ